MTKTTSAICESLTTIVLQFDIIKQSKIKQLKIKLIGNQYLKISFMTTLIQFQIYKQKHYEDNHVKVVIRCLFNEYSIVIDNYNFILIKILLSI